MARPWVDHEGSLLDLVSLFVDDVALVGEHRTNIVLFLLTTNEEDLILSLNRSELLWEDIGVPN